jgi:hypothetical protein
MDKRDEVLILIAALIASDRKQYADQIVAEAIRIWEVFDRQMEIKATETINHNYSLGE